MPWRVFFLYLINKFNKALSHFTQRKREEFELKRQKLVLMLRKAHGQAEQRCNAINKDGKSLTLLARSDASKSLSEAENCYNRGVDYYEKGDHGNALLGYCEAIKFNPTFTTAYLARGILYQEQGEYDSAISDFTQAVAIDPVCAEAYSNRANSYAEKGILSKAFSDYTAAITINPQFTAAFYDRGVTYLYKMSDFENAINDFVRVLELDSLFNPQVYINLSRTLVATKQYYNAIQVYQKFMAIYGQLKVDSKNIRSFEMAIQEVIKTDQHLIDLINTIVFIEVLSGPMTGHRFVIKGAEEFLIGKASSSKIKLIDDPLISLNHARISTNGNEYFINDLDSLRGTFLNGKKIESSVRVNYGDVITLGSTRLQFKIEKPKS
jgi:tetratricopeptide (TPR) repeat protein